MKNRIVVLLLAIILFYQCSERKASDGTSNREEFPTENTPSYGGFESQIEWGEHLVIIGLCNDCHTPKKMTASGLVLDTASWLSGHPSTIPGIDFDRKVIEGRKIVVRSILSREWVGPWGVSYAANLTPDDTGIGNWTEKQFFTALREGKYKGLAESRPLLPPMPWEMYRYMTDNEIRAIFAYLKSIKPISNLVPPSLPSASATK